MYRINFSKLPRGSVVYVFYADKADIKIPFYVGQSERGVARIGEYITASFSAETDFKVGTVARLLENKGYEVSVEVERVLGKDSAKIKEKEKIQQFANYQLVNDLPGYNYKTADETKERARLEQYVEKNFLS